MSGIRRLHNAMRAAGLGASNAHRADPQMGLVTGYDPARYAVKVTLQPSGTITGWIPLGALWVGAGWGMYAPPSLGDMVEVTFTDGHIEAGNAGLKFYNDVDQALPVTSGEFWLVHKSGAYFKLLNTGAVIVSDGQGAAVTMNGDGTMTSQASAWTHVGDITVTGAVLVSETLTAADVIGGGKHLASHKHTGGTLSGDTGVPL
jgi:phage baseplate assembly protein gpV